MLPYKTEETAIVFLLQLLRLCSARIVLTAGPRCGIWSTWTCCQRDGHTETPRSRRILLGPRHHRLLTAVTSLTVWERHCWLTITSTKDTRLEGQGRLDRCVSDFKLFMVVLTTFVQNAISRTKCVHVQCTCMWQCPQDRVELHVFKNSMKFFVWNV